MPSVQFRAEGDARGFHLTVVKPNTYREDGLPVAFAKWGTRSHSLAAGTMVIDFLCDDPALEDRLYLRLTQMLGTYRTPRKVRSGIEKGAGGKYADDSVKAGGLRMRLAFADLPTRKRNQLRASGRTVIQVGPDKAIKTRIAFFSLFRDRRDGNAIKDPD